MENNTVLWITIAAYIICLVVIGIVEGRKAKSIADLTVGGRNAGAWLSALSYGTAYFSAVMFVGYAGKTGLSFGLWGVLAGLGNAVFGSLLAWLVLARRTREISGRLKIHTMPDFFEKRYNSRAMRIFSAVVIFVFLIPYSASVYSGLASVADVLLGIDDTIFLIIIAVLAILLVTLGGYLVQARADFVQGIVITSAHMAKGLEFDEVIIPQTDDRNYHSEIDRSMLYVAVTRAMHRLTLTYSGTKHTPFI